MTIASIDTSLPATGNFTTDVDGGIQAAAGTKGIELRGKFNVTISGTFVATLSLQRSFDDGVSWHTISTNTVPVTENEETPEKGVIHRIGFTAYTSGTAVVRISQ